MYAIHMPEDKGVRYEEFRYPAGEVQVRLLDSELAKVAEADEIIVWARITTGDILALAMLKDAIEGVNKGTAQNIVLVLPYLPYGRADRRFTLGDCNGLETFGRHIDQLGFSYVVTLDAHSPITRGTISNFYNVSPEILIRETIVTIQEPLTILLPDKGASRYNLKKLGYPIVQCDKKRNSKTGAFEGFDVPRVETERVLIVDDICDGGGTFLGIAEKLPGFDLNLYTTHGIYSKGLGPLSSSFKRVFCTDSFPSLGNLYYATVLPCEPVISKALRAII